MRVLDFQISDQKETEEFIRSIYQEMGWIAYWDNEFNNLYKYFNVPLNNASFIIAKENKKIIATAVLVKLNSTTGIAKKFYIHKDYRGTGLAQNMLKALIAKAKESGLQKIVLDVLKSNLRAIKFYEKSGFQKYKQQPITSWSESQRPDIFYYYFLETNL